MKFKKVRKKPIELEAFQLTEEMSKIESGYLIKEILKINGRSIYVVNLFGTFQDFRVQTLEGEMSCDIGDWIIKGVKGEIYPCRKDIFKETYDILE